MAFGGKLILTDSSQSNLPNYGMGSHLLPKGVLLEMDSIRSFFLARYW